MYEALGIVCVLAMPVVIVAGLIDPKLISFGTAKPTRWMIPVWLLVLFGLVVILAVEDGGNRPQRVAADLPRTAAGQAPLQIPEQYRPHPAQQIATEAPAQAEMPPAESAFIAAVASARAAYATAPNELKKSNIKLDMVRAIHAAVNGGSAVNWTGTLAKLGTNGDGDALVEIEIADGITIKTWNNSFSDMTDHTLIKNRSALYNAIADLKEGSRVTFDAKLFKLSDFTERGAVEEPEMIARFSRIDAAN